MESKKKKVQTSLVVQWLRLCIPHAGITRSILGWGIKLPMPMVWQKKGKENNFCFCVCNVEWKFNF